MRFALLITIIKSVVFLMRMVKRGMKHKLVRYLSKCLLVFSALFFFSVSVASEHPRLKIGFAQDTMGNDWRAAQVREVKETLSQHPGIDFIFTDALAQTALQAKHILDLADIPVDVLIVSPRDKVVLAPVISEVYQRGIPVILLSRGIESEHYTSFIRPQNYEIGVDAAKFLLEKLPSGGQVLMLKGIPEASTTIQRTAGFMDVISEYDHFNVITLVGNFLRADTLMAMEKFLAENISFDAVYAQSDSMADALRMSLVAHGIDPSDKIIIGIDYIKSAQEAILRGQQTLSFTYPTGGKEGAEVALKILQGQEVEKEIILPSISVTIENIDLVEPIF